MQRNTHTQYVGECPLSVCFHLSTYLLAINYRITISFHILYITLLTTGDIIFAYWIYGFFLVVFFSFVCGFTALMFDIIFLFPIKMCLFDRISVVFNWSTIVGGKNFILCYSWDTSVPFKLHSNPVKIMRMNIVYWRSKTNRKIAIIARRSSLLNAFILKLEST